MILKLRKVQVAPLSRVLVEFSMRQQLLSLSLCTQCCGVLFAILDYTSYFAGYILHQSQSSTVLIECILFTVIENTLIMPIWKILFYWIRLWVRPIISRPVVYSISIHTCMDILYTVGRISKVNLLKVYYMFNLLWLVLLQLIHLISDATRMIGLHFPQRNMLTYYLYYSRVTSG